LLAGTQYAYIARVTKKEFLAFRISPELKGQIEEIANSEQRSLSQICELFLRGGVEAYRKQRGQYLQDLLRKARLKKSEVRESDKKDSRG
jgi:hypothetical protein